MRHAFVIPAYGESPYLRACIESLRSQRKTSEILITTSTPSKFLECIASEYDVPLQSSCRDPGIAPDWNDALTTSAADLVTIAHQDDVFSPEYSSRIISAFDDYPEALIAFTANTEHTATGMRPITMNLRIKRWLCYRAFGREDYIEDPKRKRRLVELGNPVCCPSVAFNRRRIPEFRFAADFASNLDWDAWTRIASMPGGMVYLRTPLVSHRVHAETATSLLIENRRRSKEDLAMFRRFWGAPTAALLHLIYRISYLANRT